MTTHRTDPDAAELHPSGWFELPELGVEVVNLPLIDQAHELDDDGAPLFARLSHADARHWAEVRGYRVVRGATLAALRALDDVLVIEPNTIVPHTQSLAGSNDHDRRVWADLRAAGWEPGDPVLGIGKHHRDGAPAGRAYLGGWWTDELGMYSATRTGPGWVQRIDTAGDGPHSDGIFDYATTTLVERDLDRPAYIDPTDPPPDTEPAPSYPPPSSPELDATSPVSSWRSPLRLGMQGDDVADWQTILLAAGYDLGRWRDDGDFGKQTHNATVAWQGERGLTRDGLVGPATRAAIGSDPVERAVPWLEPGDISFVEARHFRWAARSVVHWLVIHTSEAREASTTAEALQSYAHTMADNRVASWHAAIDDDSVAASVREQHVAFHCPGLNRYGIGVELSGYARQNEAQWRDPFSTRMRELLAQYAAGALSRWGMPAQVITADKLDLAAELIERGQPVPDELRGITTHNQGRRSRISRGRTSHTDPGRAFESVLMPELVDRIVAIG